MKSWLFILSFAVALFGTSILSSALDYNADLSLSLGEEYNDNLFLTHTYRIGDFSNVISPAIALSTRTEKANVLLNYSPTFIYYYSHSEENSISHQASVSGDYRISPVMTVSAADSFVRSSNALIIRSIDGSGPLTSGQETLTSNTLTANLGYKLTDQLTLQPSLLYSVTDNSQSNVSNVNTYSGTFLASYLLSDRTILRASAGYTHYDYSLGNDATGQDYIVGVNYKFTPTITADIYGGVDSTSISGQGGTDTGFIGGISVTKILEKGSVSIAYTQAVIPGLQNTSPLKSQVLLAHYTTAVTTRLDANLSALYGIYKAIGNISGPDQHRVEITANGGLTYRLFPWANLFLSYSYVISDDKVEKSGSYNNNVVMAGIRLSKQAKF